MSPEPGIQPNQAVELVRAPPSTAFIVDEIPLFLAVRQFLAECGMRVPDHVSPIRADASPDFGWCRPSVSRIRWDSRQLLRRAVRCTTNLAAGTKDLRQAFTPAEFMLAELTVRRNAWIEGEIMHADGQQSGGLQRWMSWDSISRDQFALCRSRAAIP
jgi:DNA-binding LacI/PurR family transcriptional regulator